MAKLTSLASATANHPGRLGRLALVSALTRPRHDEARYETVKRFYGPSFKFMRLSSRAFAALFPSATAKRTISLFSTHDPSDFMKHLPKDDIRSLLRLLKNKAYTEGPLIDIGSPPEARVLRRITAPTLVLHSGEDKSVDFDNAEYSVSNIGLSELLVSSTWSHFPWLGPGGEEQLEAVIHFFR